MKIRNVRIPRTENFSQPKDEEDAEKEDDDDDRIGRYGYASKLQRDSLQVTAAATCELSHLTAVQGKEHAEGLPLFSVWV